MFIRIGGCSFSQHCDTHRGRRRFCGPRFVLDRTWKLLHIFSETDYTYNNIYLTLDCHVVYPKCNYTTVIFRSVGLLVGSIKKRKRSLKKSFGV